MDSTRTRRNEKQNTLSFLDRVGTNYVILLEKLGQARNFVSY